MNGMGYKLEVYNVYTSPITFLQEALNTGMGNYIDSLTTYTEQNVTQKVRALKGLFHMHNLDIDIIQGESGAQSRKDGHGAMQEGAWTPRIQAKQLLRHLTIDLFNDVKFTSFFYLC